VWEMKSLHEIEIMLFDEELCQLKERLSYEPRLEIMWNHIEGKHADPELKLLAVARSSGMSEKNLRRLLQSYLQMTFRELLTRYRVYRATAVLLVKHESILNVAQSVGLGQSGLERAFARYLHMRPAEFRKECRQTFQRAAGGRL